MSLPRALASAVDGTEGGAGVSLALAPASVATGTEGGTDLAVQLATSGSLVLALAAGWVAAGLLARRLWLARRRLELVAEAEHELRGPLGALSLGLESARRGGGETWVAPLELEVERARRALGDLTAARVGRRTRPRPVYTALEPLLLAAGAAADPGARAAGGGVRVRLAGELPAVRADRVRLAQALGNTLANAVEHGGGRVELRGRRTAGGVRLEVVDGGAGFGPPRGRRGRNGDRGRGLRIAARAVEEAGGHLTVESTAAGSRVSMDLPGVEGEQPPAGIDRAVEEDVRPPGGLGLGRPEPAA